MSRLTVVSRGLLGGADTPGRGGWGGGGGGGWEFIPILTQNVRFIVGEKSDRGGRGGEEGD